MAKPVTGLVVFGASTLDSTASLDSNYAAIAAVINDAATYSNALTDTSGGANSIVVTTPVGITAAYVFGLQLYIKIANTNTSTAVTINMNGLGAKTVTLANGALPPVGTLLAGGVYPFTYDGANFQTTIVGVVTGLANPTATIGLAAVNGALTTAMRSDAAPALSQAIIPVWTGGHTFQAGFAATGTLSIANASSSSFDFNANVARWLAIGADPTHIPGVAINADSSNFSVVKNVLVATASGSALTSVSLGDATDKAPITLNGPVTIPAPTSGNNLTINQLAGANAILVQCANGVAPSIEIAQTGAVVWSIYNPASTSDIRLNDGTQDRFIVKASAGGVTAWGPVAAAQVDMTPDTSSFTITLTGMTAGTTATATWFRIGKFVILFIPAVTGTSNSTSFTLTGIPAAIQPATANSNWPLSGASAEDNGATASASINIVAGSGTWTMIKGTSATAWTAAGAKGFAVGICVAYPIY